MGHRQYAIRQVLGQSHAISMVSLERGWANSKPLVASPWSTPGPIPHYWPCLPQGKLGQSHAISIVSLEGDWANSMPLAVPLRSDHGPLAVCHLAGAGPIPCYWHGLFVEGLGQLKATGSLTLEQLWAISNMLFGRCWANSTLLAMPVSREAGSIPCYRHCIFRGGLGQLNAIGSPASERPWAIGSMPFSRCWANPMLSAWSLWVRGWANSKPPVALPWSNSGPIPCYRPCMRLDTLRQSHAIIIVSLDGH